MLSVSRAGTSGGNGVFRHVVPSNYPQPCSYQPKKSVKNPSTLVPSPPRHIPSITMPTQERKGQVDPEQEAKELCRLLSLINTPASKQQLPSIDFEGASVSKSHQWPAPQPKSGAHQHQSTEALTLEQFSLKYQSERQFREHPQIKYLSEIFSALVKNRLNSREWTERAPPENILRVLVCLRIMMRDASFQKVFLDLGAVKVLAEHLQKATDSYLAYGDGPYVVDILKEMTNIFQKLSAVVDQRDWIVACGAHKTLVLLLSANDIDVLHCSMYALICLAQSPSPRSMIGELNIIETLQRILQDYDVLSKNIAANLLRLLCGDQQVREMIKVYDGIPLLLSLLHGDNAKLLWSVVWCLVQLAEDPDVSNDIRQMGGIPLIINLLLDRKFVPDRSVVSNGLASATVNGRTPVSATLEEDIWGMINRERESVTKKGEELRDNQLSLKSACCAALTELVLNDTNAQQIVQSNGVYYLGLLILPQETTERDRKHVEMLQRNAFRALRFLFSMERNRQLFKRLFPPDLFAMFIDIGHYVRDIAAYKPLVDKLNGFPSEKIEEIKENIKNTNQNKPPNKYIGDYAVMDVLGSGAFGCVYRVKKKTAGQSSFLAMKEVTMQNPTLGKSAKEKEKSIGEIISELTIIKEQLRHPNIVRYYKTFSEDDRLYIIMDLIEGAPIGEHFNSLKEKKTRFREDRVWNIFIQIVLALRYLHKEKGIVHRDLSPNNIMLGENDKVTITDFGLAKQKQKDTSKMNSVVGTILYSCPEIVQSQSYGEKADVWAIGCILYQMSTLKAPFYSTNMLSLAKSIVEADYEPIPSGWYSDEVSSAVQRCLTADPTDRPDIVQVASHIADKVMIHMDNLRINQIVMEKKLEKERKRTQRHFNEANKNMQNYHRLFLASQERYDKLVNLASSGGAASIKDGDLSDNVFSDSEAIFTDLKSRGIKSASRSRRGVSVGSDDHNNNEKGWVSDDESYQSSSGSCESSGGGTTLGNMNQQLKADQEKGVFAVPQPPKTPRSGTRRNLKLDQLSQQLTLDIPGSSPIKSSRDSGISSSEPSPNNSSPSSAANSTDKTLEKSSLTDTVHRRIHSGGRSGRPNSATTATLSISPRKVRQISDPILQILHMLHKIIYITQLPPTLCHNPRRRTIERFKRALFAPQSTSFNLKNELKKLLIGSQDVIDLNFGPSEAPLLTRQASLEQEALSANAEKTAPNNLDLDGKEVGITYEQMVNIIESVLVESGYYDMSPNAQNRRMPLGPIGGDGFFLNRTPSIVE